MKYQYNTDSEKKLYFPDRAKWRDWLEENHDKEERIWMIYYKKHTGKPSVPYDEAVEEALCFGWIDSLVHRLDDERYMQKYTPRKPKSTWSELNVRRVEKMIAEGKMTSRGLELYDYARDNGLLPDIEGKSKSKGVFPETPDFFIEALSANPKAEKFFNALASSYKLQFLGWIMDAKKIETKIKRTNEAIELLESGKKLGMK